MHYVAPNGIIAVKTPLKSSKPAARTSGTVTIRFPKSSNALRKHADDVGRLQAVRPRTGFTLVSTSLSPRPAPYVPPPSSELRRLVARAAPDASASPHPQASDDHSAYPPRTTPYPGLATIGRPADIGVIVRERRIRLGLSQADLAEQAGVGRRFVSELEAGKVTVELAKVLVVCRVLGLRLLAGADNE